MLLQREDKGIDMIWYALRETVNGVESMACKRRRHDPLVVRLVQCLVYRRVVEASVDPVDEHIRKGNEQGELEEVVPQSGAVGSGVIHFGVAANFEEETGGGKGGNARHRLHGLLNLKAYLVFDVFGVLEGGFVKDKHVRQACDNKIQYDSEDPKRRSMLALSSRFPYSPGCILWVKAAYQVIRNKENVCL